MELRKELAEEKKGLTRRQFILLGGGALALLGIGYGIARHFGRSKGIFSMDMSFLGAERKFEPIVGLEEPAVEHELEKSVQDYIAQQITSNPKIKEDWYARGGTGGVQLTLDQITRQFCFVPELNSKCAEAYKSYCAKVIDHVLKRCDVKNDIPLTILNVKSAGMVGAGIVNNICDMYDIQYTLSQEGIKSLSGKILLGWRDGTAGGYRMTCKFDLKTGSSEVTRTPFLFATAEDKYIQFETPVAEAVHHILYPATKRIMTAGNAHNESEARERINHWVKVDEAVAHAVGDKLLEELIEKYNLPVNESDHQKRIDYYSKDSRYSLVGKASELVKKYDAILVKMYLEDPEKVALLLK